MRSGPNAHPALATLVTVALLFNCIRSRPTGPSGAPGRAKTFEHVSGWSVLRWTMGVEEAKNALKRKSIGFKEETIRGYFARPAPPPDGPGTPGRTAPPSGTTVVCVAFPQLLFRTGPWQATAEFSGGRLRSVTLTRSGLQTEAAVRAVVRDLEREYGPPKQRRPVSRGGGGQIAQWSNAATVLIVDTTVRKGRIDVQLIYRSTGAR